MFVTVYGFKIPMTPPDLTSYFVAFINAHQLTVRVPKHEDTGADVPRGPERWQPAGASGAVACALKGRGRPIPRTSF